MRRNLLLVLNIMLILMSGCSLNSNKENQVTFSDDKTIKWKSDFNACELVKSINGTTVTDDMIKDGYIDTGKITMTCSEIDTSKIGQQKVYFDIEKKMYGFTVEVKDDQAPVIKVDDKVTVNVDPEGEEETFDLDSFDLNDYFTVSDDDEVKTTDISGNYDLSENGEYKIKISATDRSGNTSEKTFTLIVEGNAEEPEVTPTPTPTTTPKATATSKPTATPQPVATPIPTPVTTPDTSYSDVGHGTEYFSENDYGDIFAAQDACFARLNSLPYGSCEPSGDETYYILTY